jgi:DNA-binding IclR family transcriptional regulator
MAGNKASMNLQDISISLKLPTSTVFRFLKTLLLYGYVKQDKETLKYSLSLKFCRIAELIKSQLNIRNVAYPFLIELSEKCQESVSLSIEDEMEVTYVEIIEGPDKMIRTMQRIGKRAPLHCTGSGKLFLSNYDESKIDEYIKEKGLIAFTKNTISSKAALLSELENIRSRGYSLDKEECEIGAKCIAAPLRDYTGSIIAGVSITGPISRMTDEKISQTKDLIIAFADKISNALGYHR